MAVSGSRDPDVVNVVALGVISWTTAFVLVRKLLRNRSFELCNRVVSTLHAALAVTLASLSVQDLRCPICPLASQSSPFQPDANIGAGLAYQKCGSEMVAALLITEISSPFLHLREILKEIGYRNTELNFAADIAFAVIFSFARMVGGPYLTYLTLSSNVPLLIKAMALGLQLVSAYWFYKIVRMVRFKLNNRSTLKNN